MQSSPVRLATAASLALIMALTGCGDDPLGPRFPEDVEYDPSLGVDLDQMTELESGVYIQTLVEGEGAPAQDGATVIVDYTLWLPDGTEIDSGEDVDFRLDEGEVIDGFRLGMSGAEQGETRLIVVPSQLGYGAGGNSAAGIPPHSVLVFRVTLDVLNPPM